jgi:hypothetical protein
LIGSGDAAFSTLSKALPRVTGRQSPEGPPDLCSQDDNLERYRQALNATDDKERRELFMTIAALSEQRKERLDPLGKQNTRMNFTPLQAWRIAFY